MIFSLTPNIFLSKKKRVAIDFLSGSKVQLTPEEFDTAKALTIDTVELDFNHITSSLLEKGVIQLRHNSLVIKENIHRLINNYFSSTGSLCIMPTEKCNFRCTYCYESFLIGKMQDNIVNSIKLFLTKNIAKFKVYSLGFFGGEPLLHPEIVIKVSSHYRALQKKYNTVGSIGITTNGFQLTLDTIIQLNSVNIDFYHISIDGPEDIHNSQRKLINGKGTYEIIIENIKTVLENSNSKIIFRINFSKNKTNESTITSWLENEIFPQFSKFVDRINYHVVSIWDASTTSVDGICIKDLQTFHAYLEIQKTISKNKGFPNSLDYLLKEISSVGSLACYAGKPNHYIVGSNGKIYKCSVAFDLAENNLGYLTENGELLIDGNKEKLWTEQNSITDQQCNNCSFNTTCMGLNCPLARIQTNKQPCPTEKIFIEEYIEATTTYESNIV